MTKSQKNLTSKNGPPAPWHEVTDVFDEAILHGDMGPGTGYPVTRKQWEDGYDAEAFSTTGKTPTARLPDLHRLVAATILK
jgi:hypothetical protein